ncbi:MAG: hypothetical protein V7L29_22865 [Nostoc sp.]|uniref:hypothetical protein n=1 Tax=Nostoc sp. TaxID=1180 RepID=UPI002FF5BC45
MNNSSWESILEIGYGAGGELLTPHGLNHSYPLTARAKRPAIANSTFNDVVEIN